MRYRSLGSTGLQLSEIGFGCGGNAGLMTRGDRKDQTDVVARAIELGVNYFDNSPDYGDGAAERNLGDALKTIKQRPLLNSKVEIRQPNLDDIAGHVIRSAEASLKRLGVDHLDVLQIHNGPAESPPDLRGTSYRQLWIESFFGPGGAIAGLERLLRDGKIRYAGFICRGNDGVAVRRLLECGIFHVINVPYTLFNPTAGLPKPAGLHVDLDYGGVINDALARGVGAAIYSPLAGGHLTDDSVLAVGRHPLARPIETNSETSRRRRHMAHALRKIAQASGSTLAQMAFSFILAHKGVTTVLGGFSARGQLEDIATRSETMVLTSDMMNRLEAVWQTNFAQAT